MKYEIKPQKFKEAWQYFIDVPHYHFYSFLKKDPFFLESDQIIKIEKLLHKNTFNSWKVYIKTENYEGYIKIYDQKIFENYPHSTNNAPEGVNALKELFPFPKYFLISPTFSVPIYSLLVGGFFFIGKNLLPIFKTPSLYANTLCDKDCVRIITNFQLLLVFKWILDLGGLAICLYFIFIQSKKIKNLQMHNVTLFSSYILLPVLLITNFKTASWTLKDDRPKYIVQSYYVLRDPNRVPELRTMNNKDLNKYLTNSFNQFLKK